MENYTTGGESMLYKHVFASLNSRETQTYSEREFEIMKVTGMVMDYEFLPRFILLPIEGRLVSLPITRTTWESIRKDAGDLHDEITDLQDANASRELQYRADAFNLLAAFL
jgi:hypothetical protein